MRPLHYFLRDNSFTNRVIRSVIRRLLMAGKALEKLSNRFRVYGIIDLKIEKVDIRCSTFADDLMANGIYYNTDFERDEFRMLQMLVAHSRLFVEVGSYTGIYSMFVAKLNPAMEILCVEPHPNNYRRILDNVALNRLTNVKVINAALGDQKSKILFSLPKEETLSTVGSINHAFSTAFHGTQSRQIEVEQVTLDGVLGNHTIGMMDVVKIDVEYYELAVLKGSLNTLNDKKPLIMVEIILSERLIHYIPSLEGNINEQHALEVEGLLKKYGYFPYHILRDGIYRVDSVINSPDTRNFLFAPKATNQRFISFDKISDFFLKK